MQGRQGVDSLSLQPLQLRVGTHCLNTTVAPEETCPTAVRSIPTSLGAKIAKLTYIDDAGRGSQDLALACTGVVPPVCVGSTRLDRRPGHGVRRRRTGRH